MPSLKHNEENPPRVIAAALIRSLEWVRGEELRENIEQHIKLQLEKS